MLNEVIQQSKMKNYSCVVIEMPEKMVSMSEMKKKKEKRKKGIKLGHVKKKERKNSLNAYL